MSLYIREASGGITDTDKEILKCAFQENMASAWMFAQVSCQHDGAALTSHENRVFNQLNYIYQSFFFFENPFGSF